MIPTEETDEHADISFNAAADAACALSHVRDESSFTATTAQACGPNDALAGFRLIP